MKTTQYTQPTEYRDSYVTFTFEDPFLFKMYQCAPLTSESGRCISILSLFTNQAQRL